jgi:hypothetical protein
MIFDIIILLISCSCVVCRSGAAEKANHLLALVSPSKRTTAQHAPMNIRMMSSGDAPASGGRSSNSSNSSNSTRNSFMAPPSHPFRVSMDASSSSSSSTALPKGAPSSSMTHLHRLKRIGWNASAIFEGLSDWVIVCPDVLWKQDNPSARLLDVILDVVEVACIGSIPHGEWYAHIERRQQQQQQRQKHHHPHHSHSHSHQAAGSPCGGALLLSGLALRIALEKEETLSDRHRSSLQVHIYIYIYTAI